MQGAARGTGRDEARATLTVGGAGPPDAMAREVFERGTLFQFLAEHSRDVLWRAAPDATILYVSPSVRAVLGYEPEDLVGTVAYALTHPDDLEAWMRGHADRLEDAGPGAVTVRTRRKDGSYIWSEFLAKAVRDPGTGAVREVVATSRDVTERRLAEMAIAESERRFRATFEQAAVGVGHLTLEGRWLRVNQRLCEILGYVPEELLSRTLQGLAHPEDAPRYLDRVGRLLAGSLATFQVEMRILRKDGEIRWLNTTLSLVRRDNGEPDYLLAVVEDIQHRKRSEQELVLARRELAQMEKLSALGTLVGGVAHEVRTPLAYASNHLNWMQLRLRDAQNRSLAAEDVGQFQQSITEALDGLDRINRLVQDLRRFARRDTGHRAPADLNDIVRDALDLFRATHRGTHPVEPTLAAVPPVVVDRMQLQQVILNLLENAADAMARGGRIEVETRAVGTWVEVLVRDRGTGIPPDVQPRIFDALYTTKPQGMGLGLSIVKRIVEAHGGRITFETRLNEGTTFTVRIPLSP